MSVKVNFIGRLGADAEKVELPQQKPFISFRAAVNERINKEDVTTWMTVTADFSRYENMAKYLTKGCVVSVNGTERCTLYTSKNGQTGIDRKVSADSIEFVNLGKKESDGENGAVRTNATKNPNDAVAAAITTGGLRSNVTAQPATTPIADGVNDDLPF